ncbi:ABC transporter ATP-binding protein [Lyngbya confervoides]|uniref:ABC transporter ATP-binding protein n=1 Tax=Lyngbya confervoides BDU141951 TaxID=1574623 RepID=A0ABD4TAZ2_9CYAN|nr:ABC transporter ATP-binding protein [Lyngbya confervoides]MCM1985369.1 ABC transporter ATP-binding protein [Lyngbya confervoides BDU141951]
MIEVEHLSKVYGSTTAIEDVSFTVNQGEILGLLGPNGAGKTTTMRILAGYLPASAGTAKVSGQEVHENPMAVRRCIGYLPENPPLYLDMEVVDYLNFVARIKGVAPGDRRRCVDAALSQCGLAEQRRTIIRKLSKGYRQRVGIAQAIVHEPAAIILDEPTVGLDPRQIIEVRKLIKSLAGDRTIILSSHILPEVRMTCDRIAIIHRGRVADIGSPHQLVTQLSKNLEYELELKGDPDIAQAVLDQIPELQQVERLEAPLFPAHHIRFKVTALPDQDPAPKMASLLLAANLDLFELRRMQASLEEVFLKLTMNEGMGSDSPAETALPTAPIANAPSPSPLSETSEL